MPERMEWLADGTAGESPHSPRFGDRYHSEPGGLEQAKAVFLQGCRLPEAWAGQPQWCVLETGFGLGLNFLVTWAAWKADPQRPRLLHFVSTEAFPASPDDVFRSAWSHPELISFAQALKDQLWGLLPGMHRLVFEGGQVLLTLCIGDAKAMLQGAAFEADSVYLGGSSPLLSPDIWDVHTFKAVARCCRRGTRVASWAVERSVREALAQCGFVVQKFPGMSPGRDNLQGHYQPAWELKKSRLSPARRMPADCIVIGAGLAGAAVAASLARRGWQVTVLDAASTPAAGASGLPAGVLAAHVSPDDSVLSRLSRSGIRVMLQQADSLLQTGTDWRPTGVLEHCIEHARKLPAAWQAGQPLADAAHDWTTLATAEQLKQCGLAPETPALWHVRAGWIKPARLVRVWLASPGVTWRGQSDVRQLVRQADKWQVLDAAGQVLAQAELVVLAAGHGSGVLAESAGLGPALALQAIRGQASWGLNTPHTALAMPAFPVNGHGSLVPAVPLDQGMGWVIGSTFERDSSSREIRPADELHNFCKLQTLQPLAAQALANQFDGHQVQGWAGIRCATPSRLPSLGPLENVPDVWVSSGMGSRGLSFAALCAELLAARLHGEPLPLEQRLADALLPQYVKRHANTLKT
ncbi:tRNA (5-methylaminomethyl-2-thiouridylate)-methyltransferase / FAD-dependent cmnm(5)s(2)U34 oxidoreductase [Polaromonas sp. CG9_12]|nr:tRNA (5-methylaminomethyl-2-thiouridylate)-methyltransferase / FAD-dependent cmnm(5)s(2)U34 oxidoreductase [Polaromonas sp. CG9_12]